jgi:hypothetical protein
MCVCRTCPRLSPDARRSVRHGIPYAARYAGERGLPLRGQRGAGLLHRPRACHGRGAKNAYRLRRRHAGSQPRREMLRYGPYPVYLKRRILSEAGHLSNGACGELAAHLAGSGTRRFLLGHLSREKTVPSWPWKPCALRSTGRVSATRSSAWRLRLNLYTGDHRRDGLSVPDPL